MKQTQIYGENIVKTSVEQFNLPKDVILGDPIIEISGRNCLFIENYSKIIYYDDYKLIIACKNYKVVIDGEQLIIDYYTKNETKISGGINGIFYEFY